VASPPEAATLRLQGLTVARGEREVLHDVSLDIPPGEVTALLGPNGAGKSTLVLAVGGVLRPVAGRVLLGSLDLTRSAPEKIRQAGWLSCPKDAVCFPI
jgi:branched-chain amino acid transport system ATP-binding protein